MITEKKFLREIAEIILSEVENNPNGLTKTVICADGHFSPQMLTRERLFDMKAETMARFFLYVAWALPSAIWDRISAKCHVYITTVADKEDGTVETIFNNHAGSPINTNDK